jgi:hypothetical protein
VAESAVIKAPLSHVWHQIKLESFADWWSALKSSKLVKGVSDDTDVIEWTFNDGSVVQVKQEEHSVSSPQSRQLLASCTFWITSTSTCG